MMDKQTASLVGSWDMYFGSMHTELLLDQQSNYSHVLSGTPRRHWGTWALEDQNGVTFLVLRLTGAQPLIEFGPYGPVQIPWPAFEAYAVLTADGMSVTLANGAMLRKPEAPSMPAPAYQTPMTPAPFVPAASMAMPAAPAPAMPSPAFPQGPRVSPAPMACAAGAQSPDPQTVVEQWKQDHATWNKVREIYAQIAKDDADTTRKIEDMNSAMQTAKYKSQLDNSQALSDVISANSQRIIKQLRGG
jgi:hypothetical protein